MSAATASSALTAGVGACPDPFLSHLITTLSIYELTPTSVSSSQYTGQMEWYHDSILRAVERIARRMLCVAESEGVRPAETYDSAHDSASRDLNSEEASLLEYPTPSHSPSDILHRAALSADAAPDVGIAQGTLAASSAAPPALAAAAFEREKSAVDELKLLKMQLGTSHGYAVPSAGENSRRRSPSRSRAPSWSSSRMSLIPWSRTSL
jgi:hypothetical protein